MEDMALTDSILGSSDSKYDGDNAITSSFESTVRYSTKNNSRRNQSSSVHGSPNHQVNRNNSTRHSASLRAVLAANKLAESANNNNTVVVDSSSETDHTVKSGYMDATHFSSMMPAMTQHQNRSSFKFSAPPSHTLSTVTEVPNKSLLRMNNSQTLSVSEEATGGTGNKPSLSSPPSLNADNADPHHHNTSAHDASLATLSHPVRITSRIVFLKVGQVDTRNERFDAEAYVECSWEDDQIFKILADPNMAKNMHGANPMQTMLKNAENAILSRSNLVNLKNIINNISVLEYDPNLFWSPQLYIENAIGELKEEVRHKLEIVEKEGFDLFGDDYQYAQLLSSLTVRVCEMRKIRGVFYERLELYDFPMDTQELSITLTSKRNSREIEFVENEKDPCSVNTEDFLDQQEWDLFGHVTTSHKTIYDPWRKYDRAGFSVTCFIARKPGYYLYNAYMLIFLITALGFVPFAFDPGVPQFRCQVTGLLLLTSVNFRWIVTQRLPSVAYLTSLDKYAIGSLLCLVLFCIWHSIIGSDLITGEKCQQKKIDSYVLIAATTFYLLYNLFCAVWFVRRSRTIKKFQKESEMLAARAAQIRDEYKQKKKEEEMAVMLTAAPSPTPAPKALPSQSNTLSAQSKREIFTQQKSNNVTIMGSDLTLTKPPNTMTYTNNNNKNTSASSSTLPNASNPGTLAGSATGINSNGSKSKNNGSKQE